MRHVEKLRKNASLATVAKATRADANIARRFYESAKANWEEDHFGPGAYDRQFNSQQAFARWVHLSELATHLERLSSLKG